MSTRPDHPFSSPEPRAALDDLSRRALSGDQAAMADLHAALTPGLVRHFLRKLSGETDRQIRAEELAQSTWVLLWSLLRAGKYDPARSRLTTFIYAVGHIAWLRFMREHHRAARRAPAHPDLDTLTISAPDDPSAAAQLAGDLQAVRDALAGTSGDFSPQEREVLRAIGSGRTDRELAALIGVSPSTAHQRKQGALQRLAAWLSGPRPHNS